MRFYFLLFISLIYIGVSAQVTIHSTELPVMTRSAIHNILMDSSGEKLYYFTSRSCSTSKFYFGDQFGVKEITITEPILAISGVVDHFDNVWILSDYDGLQIIKMDIRGTVLESWMLPMQIPTFSPDPKLILSDQLELLLDGRIYRLDPFNQLIESVDTPVAFTNLIYHEADNQLIAYNDTLLCFIDESNKTIFEVAFPSILDVFIGPLEEIYQVGRWSIQAVSSDEGVRRLVNFSEPILHGMVCRVGEQYLLFKSPSSLFWESYSSIDMQQGMLEDEVFLSDMGYLLTYPVYSIYFDKIYMLGFDQYAYRVLTMGEDFEEGNLPDIMIHQASGRIQDWSTDRDEYQIQVQVTVDMQNLGDVPIEYFTIACSTATESCQGWYYFTDSISGFDPQTQATYTFTLSMAIEDLDLDNDSIYLAELWVLAINGRPDKNRADNQISAFAHFVETTASYEFELPFEAVIYPNPCTDVLYVKSGMLQPFTKLHLYNSKGKMVRSLQGQNTVNSVSDLPSGHYFLLGELDDGRKSKTSLIIKK